MPEEERYQHLRLQREVLNNSRHTKPGFSGSIPEDVLGHAKRLTQELKSQVQSGSEDGYDPRRLLKFRVTAGVAPELFEAIPGLKVISHENREVLVMFADEHGLQEFQSRLSQLETGQNPTRKDIFFAIKGIEGWTIQDRSGPHLEGVLSKCEPFVVDVELWSLESLSDRYNMIWSFKKLCEHLGASVLDELNQTSIYKGSALLCGQL